MIRLKIDAKEKHKISPYLYMQFMEPLGVADSSVDAAWDFVENEWFPEVINISRFKTRPYSKQERKYYLSADCEY